jgi:alpha-tubulin suppressor-like RCC1 family protein
MDRTSARALLFGAIAALGCRAPTEIRVTIATDIPCAELEGVAITVATPSRVDGEAPATVTNDCDGSGNIGSIVVLPAASDDEDVAINVVAGRGLDVSQCVAPDYGPHDSRTGCIVARRSLHFVSHSPLDLPIELRGVCVGEPCIPGQTCDLGSCVPAQVTDPSQCTGDGCSVGKLFPNLPANAIVQVVAGGISSCVVRADRTITCWGDNTDEQLGDGKQGTASPLVPEPAMLGVPNPVRMTLARGNGCAMTEDGRVYCAGTNNLGGLGSGGVFPMGHTTVPVMGLPDAVQIHGGMSSDQTACAVRHGGSVVCWGDGGFGQLGDGGTPKSDVPVPVKMISGVVSIAGGEHPCAATSDGLMYCWGNYPLGDGTMNTSSVPVLVPALTDVVEIATRIDGACARKRDGTVWCWGATDPGDGSASSLSPVQAMGVAGAVQIAVGGVACAVLASGQVMCWGRNDSGQLGNDSTQDSLVPVFVDGVTNAVQVSIGDDHACALLLTGQITCWGGNDSGQVTGDGKTSGAEQKPVIVAGL